MPVIVSVALAVRTFQIRCSWPRHLMPLRMSYGPKGFLKPGLAFGHAALGAGDSPDPLPPPTPPPRCARYRALLCPVTGTPLRQSVLHLPGTFFVRFFRGRVFMFSIVVGSPSFFLLFFYFCLLVGFGNYCVMEVEYDF